MPEHYYTVTRVLQPIFPPPPEGFEGLGSAPVELGLPFLDLLKSPGFVQALNHLTASEAEPTVLSRLQTKLKPCQAVGVTKLLRSTEAVFKGAFLCDEAGMGKSLTALTAALIKREQMLPDCGFVLVVCPPEGVPRWRSEALKHFKDDSQPSCIILDSNSTPVTELLRHEVVICSTTFLMKTFDNYDEYKAYSDLVRAMGIEEARPLLPNRKLACPSLPLHSDTYKSLNKKIAALILDESHHAHDWDSKLNKAVRSLDYHCAFLLSGTPFKSSWRDLTGQSMILPGSLIRHIDDYCDMFEMGPGEGKKSVPEGVIWNMFERYFMAQILSRPKSALNLPDWTMQVISVVPDPEPRKRFIYMAIRAMANTGKELAGEKKNPKNMVAVLNHAQQLANHPVIYDSLRTCVKMGNGLAETLSKAVEKSVDKDEKPGSHVNAQTGDEQRSSPSRSGEGQRANKEWTESWLKHVRGMDNVDLLSPRVRAITSTVNELLRCHQDEKIVIASTCVQLLDLLSEALYRDTVVMDKKDMIAQCDLSVEEDKRASIIDAFNKPIDMAKKGKLCEALHMTEDEWERSKLLLEIGKADDPSILLLDTNLTNIGSVDLNLTEASRIILCHYFWEPDMARRVINRAHQMGQKKVVHVYQVFDELAAIDAVMRDLTKPTHESTRGDTLFYTRLDTDFAQVPEVPTCEEYALAPRELSKNKEAA